MTELHEQIAARLNKELQNGRVETASEGIRLSARPALARSLNSQAIGLPLEAYLASHNSIDGSYAVSSSRLQYFSNSGSKNTHWVSTDRQLPRPRPH
jgi:hypothetical protein